MDLNKIKKLAKIKHQGQSYGGKSYMTHLNCVAIVAKEFINPEHKKYKTFQALAYLHDSLEDTDITEEEILSVATEEVLTLVKLLTDKPGKNRHERHLNTYYLIRDNEDAVLGKLFDRIANLRYCIASKNEEKGFMYLKESREFKLALYDKRHESPKKVWAAYDEEIKNLLNLIK